MQPRVSNLVRASAASPSHIPDLTACDREPIHIPGSIQPHGLLLVVDPERMIVVGGAGAIEDRLAPDWQGRSIDELLGQSITERLAAHTGSGNVVLAQVRGCAESFDATAHRSAQWLLIELEPAMGPYASAAEVLLSLDAAGVTFERAANLRDLCERAAAVFRTMTGFARVMIYQFLDDEAGVVVAEAREEGLGSFLNHHFPASDIPHQARALYMRNRVRVIPDVGYEPARLRSASVELTALDMSDVALRSVSPIHVQYLKNMDVRASASISIVKDGLLWGLIACHHPVPHLLSFDARMACRTLAGGLARQIRAKEEAEAYREQLRLRSAEDTILGRLGRDSSLYTHLGVVGDELRQILCADGFAAAQGKDIFALGHCPDTAGLRQISTWVRDRAAVVPFSSNVLPQRCEPAQHYVGSASGLMAVTVATDTPMTLMWFRAEEIEVVTWAGNPHKAVGAALDAVLTPRHSFEAWAEVVRGRSRAWTLAEVETASRLKRNIFDAWQNQRVRDLNRDLTATIADKEQLLLQKDVLMKEVNHRVQNSLQLVSAFLSLQARAANDAALTDHLNEARRRLSAVGLVHRRLYADDQVEVVDLARYLDDLCKELETSMGVGDEITLSLAPTLISADRAVNVGLILTELIINANKYAYGGASGPMTITLEHYRQRFRLIVADRGTGKSGARIGFGTRMLNAMVDRLGGTVEETSNDPGLRVIVTAPVEGPA